MNKNYFNSSEDKCYEKLQDFNQYLRILELGRMEEKSPIDASGLTSMGYIVSMELKNRNQNLIRDKENNFLVSGTTYIEDTMMIETHKLASLLLEHTVEHRIPLYINFLNDNVVIVHNPTRLKEKPRFEQKKIKSKGYEKIEVGVRMFLSLKDAYIYQKDNNGTWHKLN